MPQLFVDMDGVLADFDRGHEIVFGVRASKTEGNVDWDVIRAIPGYFQRLPPMPDMFVLWEFVDSFKPIVLTGVPPEVPAAADDKRAWVTRYLGEHVEVRCCASKDKYLQARPGDILIDDWEKYKHLWIAAGGRWITHTSTSSTIVQLCEMVLPQ